MYDFKTFFWDLEWKTIFTNLIEQLHIKVKKLQKLQMLERLIITHLK